jgi:hypothetical protein
MHLSLHTSATKQALGSFTSPAVPRSGELINLGNCIFQVTNVCYQITDQESSRAIVEVKPVNEAARQHIGEALLKAS